MGEGDGRVDQEDAVVVKRGSPEGEVKAFNFAHVVVNCGCAGFGWEEVCAYIEGNWGKGCPQGMWVGAV